MSVETININGRDYVPADEAAALIKAEEYNDMTYCIVRTYSAGVFAGYLESLDGKTAVIRNVRRIWYWDGACSLSQLAKEGTKKPENCKFAVAVDKITVTEAIEILECTQAAFNSITSVEEWKA